MVIWFVMPLGVLSVPDFLASFGTYGIPKNFSLYSFNLRVHGAELRV